jgi:hypothetical protein
VIERVYEGLRGNERTLDLADLEPQAAIKRLIEFNFEYCRKHPQLIGLINNENVHQTRYRRKSKKVGELHSPFVRLIGASSSAARPWTYSGVAWTRSISM